MKRGIIILIINVLLMLSAQLWASDRKTELLNVIDDELSEVTRLSKQIGNRKPSLLLRMAELLLEKARVVKEIENEKFLKLSSAKRQKINRKRFFRRSYRYFQKAQKVCHFILKRFRRFKGRASVYYILAFNAKEYGRIKKAQKYFKQAIKFSRKNSLTNLKSKLSLADIYYNQGQYKRAIPLYTQVLNKKRDKWWTKDGYNLAWCYFRVKKYNQAVRTMKKVHRLSKNPKYIDMSDGAEKDLAYFYSEMGKPKEAVRFYKKSGKKLTKNLLKTGEYLLRRGKYTSAEKVLTEALQYQQSDSDGVAIHIALIGLYDRFGKVGKHLKTSEKLKSYYLKGLLNKEQIETLNFQVQKMSATLQKQVVGKTYVHRKKARLRKARWTVQYLKILMILKPKKVHEFNFAAAETLYSCGEYDQSVHYYDIAYNQALSVRNKKISILCLEGMMAALGQRGISKSTKKKYLVSTYKRYLKNFPKSKKSFKIYQRLFTIYYDSKDIASAENTLSSFKIHFPRAMATQEAMLARIMDYHRIKGNGNAIKRWVARINKGEFKVSRSYAKKVKLLLLTMQFENVETANTKGDKKKALKGYVAIYKDPSSTSEAKKNAAYNITVLFHELGDSRRTFGWAKRALSLMNTNDVLKFEASLLTVASDLFNRRKFVESSFIYEKALAKICKTKSKNKKIFFKNAYVVYLADNKVEEARNLLRESAQCNIPGSYVREARLDILKSLLELERWNSFLDEITRLEASRKMWPDLIWPYYKLYLEYRDTGKDQEKNKIHRKILRFYRACKGQGMKIPLRGLDVIAHFYLLDLEKDIEKLKSIQLSFPENVYNQRLKSKFLHLDRVTSKASKILSIGSGKGIVTTYRYLVQCYKHTVNQIHDFSPQGKSAEYIKSFKKSMVSLMVPLRKKIEEFEREAVSQISKNNILSTDNYWFLTKAKFPIRLKYRYSGYRGAGIMMDRGGRR